MTKSQWRISRSEKKTNPIKVWNSPQHTCSLPWGHTGSAAGRRAAPGRCAPWRASLSASERGQSEARSQPAALFMGANFCARSRSPQRGPPSSPTPPRPPHPSSLSPPLTSSQLRSRDKGEDGHMLKERKTDRPRERETISWFLKDDQTSWRHRASPAYSLSKTRGYKSYLHASLVSFSSVFVWDI